MRILVTNDDGIFAAGIAELALALKRCGHELFIGAPAENQSCVSHGLTLSRPLYAKAEELPGLAGIPTYAITGTPADCVRLSIGNLGADPEVIISGINQAPNLGTDALYSGTVSAAMEGAMLGIPSIAVSKDTFDTEFMDEAAEFFADMLPKLMEFFGPAESILSVNIPSKKRSEYRGVRVARTGLQSYMLAYAEVPDPDGRIGYHMQSVKLTECAEDDDTDEKMMRDGFVVVTPLTYDITEYRRMERAKELFETDL
ncbi:MAG: 5'/3'-nucleotidase SurE [Clostridia bacterium]|nr:5'/3'-nucleotidase SurE [Clostridia bacterium]